MNRGLRSAVLLFLTALAGCTVPQSYNDTSGPNSTPPAGNWTNWQIQVGSAITSPPNTYPSFLGAIQVQGSQASGIFTTVNSTGNVPGLDYGGTYAPATGNVTLATYGYGFGFTEPASPYTVVPVDVIGGCVYPPGYTGVECLALIAYSPAVGVQIAPLTGTYSGALTSGTPNMSGTGTLTLTQSSTPNSDGSFALTGSIVFPSSSDFGTSPISGTVSGEGLTLNYCSPAVVGPCISVAATVNPTATQIAVSSLVFNDPGRNINTTFTGTLARQ